MKFGSGWVIIIMDICFEMSLDLYWYDLISSHNTNIKQNLFLTDLWSSFRRCHMFSLLLCSLHCICNNLPSLEQIHPTLTFHTDKETSLALSFQCDEEIFFTWNAHFYEGKKIRPSPFFRFTLLQVFNIVAQVEDTKSSQQSIQSSIIKIW